jgi:4-amino-4-deoxy-L-arabinose transferase-like glycosyltransferase
MAEHPVSSPEESRASVNISVQLPKGARVRITLEALDDEGRVLVEENAQTLIVEGGQDTSIQVRSTTTPNPPKTTRGTQFDAWGSRLRLGTRSLATHWPTSLALETALFGLALLVYLLMRVIGLTSFPIYFFSDEAVQTILADDFLRDGFRNYDKILFPTYFKNGYQYNLSLSVYAQMLPTLIFGRQMWVTRGVSVLIGLAGAFSVGRMLRDVFEKKYWWTATLLLSMVPAWFLHSRTAFETAIAVSLYATFLYLYGMYRCHNPRYLYGALGVGALTFYAYSPAQMVIVVTGIFLLVFDYRYHWENRGVGIRGAVLLMLFALPYLRFRFTNELAVEEHFRNLASYWLEPIPTSEKIGTYAREYLQGLSPQYWFVPNEVDLARHRMKGYGHAWWLTFPFALGGFLITLWRIREPRYRILLAGFLAAPTGAALVAIGITRTLLFVVPLALMTALGFIFACEWVGKRFSFSGTQIATGAFVLLAALNTYMLQDALRNGPTWYTDYGLGGMQWGAREMFSDVAEIIEDYPNTQVIVSSIWANGTNELARFFVPDDAPIQLGSLDGHMVRRQPLTDNMLFVLTAAEYDELVLSPKFTDIRIDRVLDYPNGRPGFYFLRMRYAPNVDEIFAQEAVARRALVSQTINFEGTSIPVSYSTLDMGQIENIFDGDDNTLMRTLEANPLVVEMTLPAPRDLTGIDLVVGATLVEITARLFDSPNDPSPTTFTTQLEGVFEAPAVTFDFPETTSAQFIRLEVRNVRESEPTHVHLWEVRLR